MREFDRSEVVVSHDDSYAEIGDGPQLLSEVVRHANAAMRGRIARQHAFVQRHPRPGDALHVWHRRIAVEVGVVVAVLLDDTEDARRRRTAGHAGGDRPLRHAHAIAKKRHFLATDGNDDLQRTLRHLAKTRILLGLGLFLSRGRNAGLARGRNAGCGGGACGGGGVPPSVPAMGAPTPRGAPPAKPAKPARQLHATPETSAMRTALSPQRPHASGAVPVNFTKRFSRLLNVQAAPGLPMLPVEISVARAESINLSASQDVRRRG